MEHFDLDDMLRNGLSGHTPNARFEFKEEYWEQAVALLEADERKKKRRRVLAYACVLTLLLIPAAVIYHKSSVGSSPANTVPAPTRTETTSMAQLAPVNGGNNQNVSAEKQTQTIAEQQNKNLNTQATNFSKPESLTKETTIQQSTTLAETENNNLTTTQNTTDNIPKLQKNQIENPTKNNSFQPLINTISTAPEQSRISYNTQQSDAAISPTPLENNVESRAPLAALTLLPVAINTPDLFVKAPALTAFRLPVETAIPTPITKVHRNKPIEWGVVASISTPSGYYIDEKSAFALGANARYRIRKNIYIQGDLMWRRWKGNVNTLAYSKLVGQNTTSLDSVPGSNVAAEHFFDNLVSNNSNTQYDFGYQSTSVVAVADEIHQIELPLTVQYKWRQFALEAGLQFSAKILKRVTTEQYQTQSLSPTAQKTADAIHFEKYGSNDNRFQTALVGGINWQPLKHWHFGCRVNWSTSTDDSLRYTAEQSSTGLSSPKKYLVSPSRLMTTELRAVYLF